MLVSCNLFNNDEKDSTETLFADSTSPTYFLGCKLSQAEFEGNVLVINSLFEFGCDIYNSISTDVFVDLVIELKLRAEEDAIILSVRTDSFRVIGNGYRSKAFIRISDSLAMGEAYIGFTLIDSATQNTIDTKIIENFVVN